MTTVTTTRKRRATKPAKVTRTQTRFRFDVVLPPDGTHNRASLNASDVQTAFKAVQKAIGDDFTDVSMKDNKDGNWLIFSPSVQQALGMYTDDSPIGYISKDSVPVTISTLDVIDQLGYREQNADQSDLDGLLDNVCDECK